ncbi:MAG: hypothetical protein ACOCXQ_02965 [Patescibacteria group bacterium]
MKKNYKLIIIALTALIVTVLSTVAYWIYLSYTDTPLHWVRRYMPLGKGQVYIITESEEISYSTPTAVTIPAGAAYEVTMPGDTRNLNFLGPGRSVGYSRIELEPYLDKPVYIYGSIDEGARYWRDHHEHIPDTPLFMGGYVVNIHAVELAE